MTYCDTAHRPGHRLNYAIVTVLCAPDKSPATSFWIIPHFYTEHPKGHWHSKSNKSYFLSIAQEILLVNRNFEFLSDFYICFFDFIFRVIVCLLSDLLFTLPCPPAPSHRGMPNIYSKHN